MSAASVRKELTREVERLTALEMPSVRAKQIQAAQRHVQTFGTELAELMRVAVREMREVYGYSWADVADELGVSRARAQQIGNA